MSKNPLEPGLAVFLKFKSNYRFKGWGPYRGGGGDIIFENQSQVILILTNLAFESLSNLGRFQNRGPSDPSWDTDQVFHPICKG